MAAKREWKRFAEHPPEKGEMFIWAAPRAQGKWSIGLGYWNISGGWSDASGNPAVLVEATHWKPIGPTPDEEEER